MSREWLAEAAHSAPALGPAETGVVRYVSASGGGGKESFGFIIRGRETLPTVKQTTFERTGSSTAVYFSLDDVVPDGAPLERCVRRS